MLNFSYTYTLLGLDWKSVDSDSDPPIDSRGRSRRYGWVVESWVGKGLEAPMPRCQRRRGECGMGGISPPQPTRESGERRELSQRGPGPSPGRKRISVLSKRHRAPVVKTFVVN